MKKCLFLIVSLFSFNALALVKIHDCKKFISKHGLKTRQLASITMCEKDADSLMDYRKGDVKSGKICIFESRDHDSWVLVGEVKATDGLFNTEAVQENLFIQVSRSHKSLWSKISDASYFPEEIEELTYQGVQSNLSDKILRWESDKKDVRVEVNKSVQARGWNQKVKSRRISFELKDSTLKFDNFLLRAHHGFNCKKL